MSEIQYHIVNLINGLTLVGSTDFTEDEVYISYPLEVVSKAVTDKQGNVMGEQMVLKPYLVMSDESSVAIDYSHVVSSNVLGQRFITSYEDMVSSVYLEEITLDGNFLKDPDPAKQEIIDEIATMTPEERVEAKKQVDAMIENLTNTKKDPDEPLH